MHQLKLVPVFLLLITFVSFNSFQTFGSSPQKQINKVFASWESDFAPGGTVFVTQKNRVVYSKSFGLTNIQYNIKNKPNTVYNVGSIAKQFTAMGIILLQSEGKLNFDDPIVKYLPEFNNLNDNISIRHLLHHSSGLRASPEIFGIGEWREGDAVSNSDVYRMLSKQKSANFSPGFQYMYSNTNYILLHTCLKRFDVENTFLI